MEQVNPFIVQWRNVVEQSLQWGGSHDWKEYDFEKLSDLIFEKTGIRLSLSTLKRIWGKVKYESSPNAATLNAMARYTGYADWREFQQKNRIPELTEKESTPPLPPSGIQASKYNSRKKIFISVAVLAVIVISLGLVSL